MKRKVLSLILALAMVLSLASQSFAAGLGNFKKENTYAQGKFADVKEGDWFAESVKLSYEMGLVKGSSENAFNPKGNITVAETIALASRLHSIYNTGKAEFTQGTPWYQVYVDYALENNIITDMYKDYNAKISRANFAFILAKALPEAALTPINDVANGTLPDVKDDYRANSIYTLYRAGVLTGNDEFGTFKPDSTITRAEVAAIITRMADNTQRKVVSLKKKGNVTPEIYRAALVYVNSMLAQGYGIVLSESLDKDMGNGVTGAEMLKSQAVSFLTEFEAVKLFAIDNGLELTAEEKKELEALKQKEYAAAGGKDAFIKGITADGLSEEFFDYYYESHYYFDKISSLFVIDGKYGAKTEDISKLLSANYARVKHILIQATPGSADYDKKKAEATKLAQRLSGGADFEELLEEYGEDPGMKSNPDGYFINSYGYTPDGSQMVPEFAQAALSIDVGKVSGVVETSYGFHIIKRYPVTEANVSSYIEANAYAFMESAMMETLSTYISKVTLGNIDELNEIDVASVFKRL